MNICYSCMKSVNEDYMFCPYCSAQLNNPDYPKHHLKPGTRLLGKYIVGQALGEGGFGITYIGLDEILQRRVAIKEYYPSGMVTRLQSQTLERVGTTKLQGYYDEGLGKFLNEAKALAQFASEPGIVTVHEFFEENNTAYIVMEYLEGETLKDYLKRVGVLKPEEAVSLLEPVMNSLAAVHRSGLIHRDISPDNIIITNHGIKLLDFGAARGFSPDDNRSRSVMLKEGYAPEEQYRKRGEQGPWTDVYALSGTLYKCITGRVPDDALERTYSDELKSPGELGISIPAEIEKAIMHGLSVYAKDRTQDIDGFLLELESVPTGVTPQVVATSGLTQENEQPVVNEQTAVIEQQEQKDSSHTVQLFGESKKVTEVKYEPQLEDLITEADFSELKKVVEDELEDEKTSLPITVKKNKTVPIIMAIVAIAFVPLSILWPIFMSSLIRYKSVESAPWTTMQWYFILVSMFFASPVILIVLNTIYLAPYRRKPMKYYVLGAEIFALFLLSLCGFSLFIVLANEIIILVVIYFKVNYLYGKHIGPKNIMKYNVTSALVMQIVPGFVLLNHDFRLLCGGRNYYLTSIVLLVAYEVMAIAVLFTKRISKAQFYGLTAAVILSVVTGCVWLQIAGRYKSVALSTVNDTFPRYIYIVPICLYLLGFFAYTMVKEISLFVGRES